ncbi:MAG: hypothetical protein CVU40_12830 [Chloroflexi bacterium HGW-Chloroflexi-2]|nr:MAG: hypothetical protein CVU40_12830 [Chloroflexi bacterium HGW-Chloroflexi-2]
MKAEHGCVIATQGEACEQGVAFVVHHPDMWLPALAVQPISIGLKVADAAFQPAVDGGRVDG